MGEILQCSSCGGTNQLPVDKKSMFCAFCGNSIALETFNNKTEKKSRLKSKPLITKATKVNTTIAPSIDGVFVTHRERVDGGWQTWGKYGGVDFHPDTYKYIGGGELKVTKKEIHEIKEVLDWFSDSELESIKVLDLSDNHIEKIGSLTQLPNLESLVLSNNKIQELNIIGEFLKLETINLDGNPVECISKLPKVSIDPDELTLNSLAIFMGDSNIIKYSENVISEMIEILKNKSLIINPVNGSSVHRMISDLFKEINSNDISIKNYLSIRTKEDLTNFKWDEIETKEGSNDATLYQMNFEYSDDIDEEQSERYIEPISSYSIIMFIIGVFILTMVYLSFDAESSNDLFFGIFAGIALTLQFIVKIIKRFI